MMKKPILVIKFGGIMGDAGWEEFKNINKDSIKEIQKECNVVFVEGAGATDVDFFYVGDEGKTKKYRWLD